MACVVGGWDSAGVAETVKQGMYYEKVPSDAEAESAPLAGRDVRLSRNSAFVAAQGTASLRVQIVLVCIAYAVVGPTLVLVNNHILKSLNFPFPLFLSALGLITTSFVCAFLLLRPIRGVGTGRNKISRD